MLLKESVYCPCCGATLEFEDHVKRHRKIEGGFKEWFKIERHSCPAGCGLFRILPDFLSPHKHYDIDIIAGVLDGTIKPENRHYEDYPCERTMQRWQAWMALNIVFINAYLKSVGIRLFAIGIALVYSSSNLIEELKQREPMEWLSIIIRAVYNTGGTLEPYREHPG